MGNIYNKSNLFVNYQTRFLPSESSLYTFCGIAWAWAAAATGPNRALFQQPLSRR
jgi:hypothetical protein